MTTVSVSQATFRPSSGGVGATPPKTGAGQISAEKELPLKAAQGILLALAAILFFAWIGRFPLLDPDEGRYAEIAREMLESRDFLIPHLNNVEYFEKPPLFYWLLAGSMAILGQQEWAVRIVPGIAGFLTLLLIMGWGSRLLGRRTGVLAAWVYLTSAVPLIMAKLPIIDGVFSLFLTATWGAWWAGYMDASNTVKKRWYCLAWTCMGLATMTKGIAAIVLTGAIITGTVALRREWSALRSMFPLRGLLLFAAITLPWHLWVGLRYPSFWHFYFVVQHFGRLAGNEHVKSFWFFFLVLPAGMFPWTGLFFPAFAGALRRTFKAVNVHGRLRGKAEPSRLAGTTLDRDTRQAETLLFLVLWVLTVLGMFSLSRCKLVPYILPAYPAMALLTATYLSGDAHRKPSTRWSAAAMGALLLALIPVASHYAPRQHILPVDELTWAIRALQGGTLLAILLLGFAFLRPTRVSFCTGLVMLAFMPTVMMTVPVVVQYTKIGPLLKAMPHPLPAEVKTAEWGTYDRSFAFYARRPTILVDVSGELDFGKTLEDHSAILLQGVDNLRRLSAEGPLLVNLPHEKWPQVRTWGTLHPVAANSRNLMVGNDEFLRRTGLEAWPEQAITSPPLLLMPRQGSSSEKGGGQKRLVVGD